MSSTEVPINVDSLTEALQGAKVSPSGVSFAGKSLKLDTKEDAEAVIEEINKCKELQYLNLEGNTLGVDASKGIAEALEKHPEFKRALWKDMFTGRMKTEIPKALQFLGDGLVKAGARLTELDLSDNAFGPIGVEGLASLLRSSTCYALEELRLNNNGLGITGGKLLASALTDCYNCSKKEGKPLALKVFIAGRNRLENDGAKALASVFQLIGTLEEVAMPQNGIYHVGITALSEAFTQNKNLQILNLNDNTIGEKGAEAISKALPKLQSLKQINFGDCLLKTKGALLLADGLKSSHEKLEELILGFNEIKKQGGLALVTAMANKSKLKNLVLDGNQFGEEGATEIRQKLKEIGKLNVLGSLDDNESEEESSESESEDGSETESSAKSETEDEKDVDKVQDLRIKITPEEFLRVPSAQNFLALGDEREQLILDETKGQSDNLPEVDAMVVAEFFSSSGLFTSTEMRRVKAEKNGEIDVEKFVTVLMKVSALSVDPKLEVSKNSLKIAENMYKELFVWAQKTESLSTVNNSILVNLGLIKSEDKKIKPISNLSGCLNTLKNIIKLNYVPEATRDTIKVFMQREVDRSGDNLQLKKGILALLN